VSVDQTPIRVSRRSNPVKYTGLLDPIRKAFAKANGVKPALNRHKPTRCAPWGASFRRRLTLSAPFRPDTRPFGAVLLGVRERGTQAECKCVSRLQRDPRRGGAGRRRDLCAGVAAGRGPRCERLRAARRRG